MAELKFNRDKFQNAGNSEELKAADKAVENTIRTGQRGHYAGFVNIELGLNKLLIYPSHESIQQMTSEDVVKNEPFIVPKQGYWLMIEVEDKDEKGNVKKDKRGKSIMILKKKFIFDARIHSNVKRDIIDIYISTLRNRLEEEHGKGKEAESIIAEKMLPVFGNFKRKVMGIVSRPTWIMYVQKLIGDQKTFGRVEIKKSVKDRLNALISIEESNTPIGSLSNNPFTDINDRRALLITFDNKATDPNLYYATEIDTAVDKDPKSPTFKQVISYPLSDGELIEFLNYPSLSSLYKNSYTQRDFDLALMGLRIFDDKNEFGIFADQDFLDEAEALRGLFPEPKSDNVEETIDKAEPEGDKFDSMDREEMKEYSRINKTGIIVHSKLTDDALRSALKEWEKLQAVAESASGAIETPKEEKSDIDVILDKRPSAVGVKYASSTGETTAERIARIRGKK